MAAAGLKQWGASRQRYDEADVSRIDYVSSSHDSQRTGLADNRCTRPTSTLYLILNIYHTMFSKKATTLYPKTAKRFLGGGSPPCVSLVSITGCW